MWLRIQKAIIWLTPNVSSLKKHSTWIRLAILAPLSPTLTTSHTLPTLPILAPALPTYCIHFKATELKRVGTRYQRHNFFERQNSKKKDCDLRSFFLKNGPSLASFSFISLQFLQKIFVKNVHPVNGTGIRTHDVQIMRLLTSSLDQGSRPSCNVLSFVTKLWKHKGTKKSN